MRVPPCGALLVQLTCRAPFFWHSSWQSANNPTLAQVGRRAKRLLSDLYSLVAVPTFALNFYSPVVADQLRTGRKTATIRLGDKSPKYKKGMIVTVLVGTRYGAREKIFDAVIDKVEVKPDELARWLGQLYNRQVSESDTVTVIRFSQIIGTMF
jgi:hypothetical protein